MTSKEKQERRHVKRVSRQFDNWTRHAYKVAALSPDERVQFGLAFNDLVNGGTADFTKDDFVDLANKIRKRNRRIIVP